MTLVTPTRPEDSRPMTQSSQRTDDELRQAVEQALRGPLGPQTPHVGVAADHGCITLTGHVKTDLQRRAARVAASYVPGVELVENDIVALDRLSNDDVDQELAAVATKAIQTSPDVPYGSVCVSVHNRVVTLTGRVHSQDERIAAERAVFAVPDVQGIRNSITAQPVDTDLA
jgi:osmotically-inducible protein OsmY